MPKSKTNNSRISGLPLKVAIVVLMVFSAFSIYLMANIAIDGKIEDGEWTQIFAIFSPWQALAAAAAGGIFGVRVKQVDVNESRRQKDELEMKKNKLLDKIRSESSKASAVGVMKDGSESAINSVAEVADALFSY